MIIDQRVVNKSSALLVTRQEVCVDVCFVCQGEDEAMFVDYRKQLKMLLDRLAQVSPELLLEAIRRIFTSTMQ